MIGIEKVEQWVLSFTLAAIILLASFQIALRWFTSGGLVWIDPLLRYLVLWGGFLGAVYATAKGNHISINAIDYLLTDKMKLCLHVVTNIFSAIVALYLCRASGLFMKSEIEFGGNGLFSLPTWVWNSIFPAAFALIFLHFMIRCVTALVTLFRPTGQQNLPREDT